MADPITLIRDEAASLAHDPDLDPTERASALRSLRDRVTAVAGEVSSLLSDAELQREARASSGARQRLQARQNADVRQEVIARGESTAKQLDEAGYLSHDELDKLDEEGLLESWIEREMPDPPLALGESS